MCHQVTYTLPCEHVRTEIVYCPDATVETDGNNNEGGSSSKGGSSSSKHHKSSHSHRHHKSSSSKSKGSSSSSSSSAPRKVPCANLTAQWQPYPTPPSFEGDPAGFSASPLSPRCPLRDCPFEQKNRCWNCCWCGKAWNQTGRCGCILLIDGNQVRCEHICCPTCEPAVAGT